MKVEHIFLRQDLFCRYALSNRVEPLFITIIVIERYNATLYGLFIAEFQSIPSWSVIVSVKESEYERDPLDSFESVANITPDQLNAQGLQIVPYGLVFGKFVFSFAKEIQDVLALRKPSKSIEAVDAT